ncbi:MAG: carbohydrate-binding domain-containing protein [Ruminiclostridium sp.]|nr:carbohydrate-binding domain-containing protein [Ruminiclostridium sp.]
MRRTAALLIGCLICSGCYTAGGYTEPAREEASVGLDGSLGNGDAFSNECSITFGEMINVCGGGVLVEGNCVSITEGGVYIISGELTDGSVEVESDEPVKLILNGAAISGKGTAIRSGGSLTVESAEGTENSLSAAEDTALYAAESLTLCGTGALSVSADSGKGIKAGSLDVTECGLTVVSEDDAIRVSGEAVVNGGNFDLSSLNGKGISADGDLTVNDGFLVVRQSTEGLESRAILTVNGGYLSVTSSDDGLNAGGSDGIHTIEINGGAVFVSAEGDGLDSNGDIVMNGGTVIVFGPTHDRDGALDCGEGYKITVSGGTLLALGNAAMAQKPEKNYLFETIRAKAGNVVAVIDEDGFEMISIPITKDAETAVYADGSDPAGLRFTVDPVNVLPE